MKTNKWEKRLEEKFEYDHYLNVFVPKDVSYSIKDFISQELEREKKEIIEVLKEMHDDKSKYQHITPSASYYTDGFNFALDQAINKIKEL